jgi:hypothetical protein
MYPQIIWYNGDGFASGTDWVLCIAATLQHRVIMYFIRLCEVNVVMSSWNGTWLKWRTVGEREKRMGREGGGGRSVYKQPGAGVDRDHTTCKGGIPSK